MSASDFSIEITNTFNRFMEKSTEHITKAHINVVNDYWNEKRFHASYYDKDNYDKYAPILDKLNELDIEILYIITCNKYCKQYSDNLKKCRFLQSPLLHDLLTTIDLLTILITNHKKLRVQFITGLPRI